MCLPSWSRQLPVQIIMGLGLSAVLLQSAWSAPAVGSLIANQAVVDYQAGINAPASSSPTNTVAATVGQNSSVQLSQRITPSNPRQGELASFDLVAVNGGNASVVGVAVAIDGAASTQVLIRDPLPLNASVVSASATPGSNALVLYHRVSSDQHSYTTQTPTNWEGIDAVAMAVPNLAAGASFGGQLQVRINDNADIAINNTAQLYFQAAGQLRNINANPIRVALPTQPPTLEYFSTATYNRQARVSSMGWPLYIEANAAQCNRSATERDTLGITLASTITGDQESFMAVETGLNTGKFHIEPNVPVRDGQLNPVVRGNGILEVRRDDRLIATLSDCQAGQVEAWLLIDPLGIVFDSKSNQPLAGVTVRLIDVTGAGNGSQAGGLASVLQSDAVTPAPSVVVTGSDGSFQFPLVAPSIYRLQLDPRQDFRFPSTVAPGTLPVDRIINATGSYGGSFAVDASTGAVTLDVPVDVASTRTLFVQKVALRDRVELGDVVDYRVLIKNLGTETLSAIVLRDRLPAGFSYDPKSVRSEQQTAPEPAGGRGPVLSFAIGELAPQATRTLTYRLRVGPGAMQGDGVNTAEAEGGSPLQVSNRASAKVKVEGGAFSTRGFVVGKIFADCNGNRLQDLGEPGVPGVRFYLEDGSFVVSDGSGQYSFQGLAPLTHVLKADLTTLPPGAQLSRLSNRQMGDMQSRFIDLKNGEMQRTDFAVSGCSAELATAITERRAKLDVAHELTSTVQTALTVEANALPVPDLKAQPASGLVGTPVTSPNVQGLPVLPQPVADVPKVTAVTAVTAAFDPENLPRAVPALSTLHLENTDASPAFLGLEDEQILPTTQTRIVVKGPLSATLQLRVNGEVVDVHRIGLRQQQVAQQLALQEYIGVDLQPGRNRLTLEILHQGKVSASLDRWVRAPGPLARIVISADTQVALDTHQPLAVRLQLQDAAGLPIMTRQPISLEASLGQWRIADSDPREPGMQTFVEGGEATFELDTGNLPGQSRIEVHSGNIRAQHSVMLVPDLRAPIAVGLIEGTLNFRRLDARALQPARSDDGFDQELKHLSTDAADQRQAGARGAVFLKGKIRGDALLTLGYDSDKDTQTRLFRDIQPDQFYPVYGDESVKGFDAQSTSRLYVRIDKNRSYALYGDFQTQTGAATGGRNLGAYNRSLTGAKQHYKTERVTANVFASRDSTRQIIDELPANGTSGPFVLSNGNGLINSEQVEILTRDRNQPGLILKTALLTRFTDYEIEAFTGRLLLRAPVPSVDEFLNPLSLRIRYEIDQEGPRFWVAGADVQLQLTDTLSIGGNWVQDRNPITPTALSSANLRLQLSDTTVVSVETARTETVLGTGDGRRIELRHDAERLQVNVSIARTDPRFDNPSATVSRGRAEANLRSAYKLSEQLNLVAEALHTGDVGTGAARDGLQLGIERRLGDNVQVQAGVRQVRDRPGVDQSQISSIDTTSVRLKVSSPVPAHPEATVYGEAEQAIGDADKKMLAIGGDYALPNRGRVYARHEFISSLTGPYFLTNEQSQNTSVLGLDMDYMKDGRSFSEYRIRDAFSGRSAEAAVGLRNRWTISEGVYLNTSIERVHALSGATGPGTPDNEATAVTGAIDYTRDPLWKGSARLELRTSTASDSVLNTLALARKLDDNWTVLAKSVLALTLSNDLNIGNRRQMRIQAGAAYRDTATNRWNALGRYEYRQDRDATSPLAALAHDAHIISVHADYQATADLIYNARYAAKHATDRSYGLISRGTTQLISVRAVQDLDERWDAGVMLSTLFSNDGARQFGVGAEAGYKLAKNLWVALGYNVLGFSDRDLSESDYTNAGVYARLRFKFDETHLPQGWFQP